MRGGHFPKPSKRDILFVLKGMEAAAQLIERRVESIRRGSPPLDPVVELDLALQAVRKMAVRFSRAQGEERATMTEGELAAARRSVGTGE